MPRGCRSTRCRSRSSPSARPYRTSPSRGPSGFRQPWASSLRTFGLRLVADNNMLTRPGDADRRHGDSGRSLDRRRAGGAGAAGAGETLDELGGRLAYVLGDLHEQPLLLLDEVAEDPFHQAPARRRDPQHHRAAVARMRGAGDVTLAFERGQHAAGGPLDQAQVRRELVHGGEVAAHERVQRIALGDRDVVAADTITIPELVDANELRERVLQLFRLPTQRGIVRLHSW